jgi:hypothetical protein
MIFKLEKEYFDYLNYWLSEANHLLKEKMHVKTVNEFVFLEMNEEVADEIRDWANKEKEKKGFDSNYE